MEKFSTSAVTEPRSPNSKVLFPSLCDRGPGRETSLSTFALAMLKGFLSKMIHTWYVKLCANFTPLRKNVLTEEAEVL